MYLAAVIPAMVPTQRLIQGSGGSELCALPAAVRSTGIFFFFFFGEGDEGESQLNRPMVLVLRALSLASFSISVCAYLCALILHPRMCWFFFVPKNFVDCISLSVCL